MADIANMSESERESLRSIGGHPLNREFTDFFPNRQIREVVVVREPASRLVSHYNFSMTMRSRRGQSIVSFEEFVDSEPDNFMTQFLAKRLGETRPWHYLDHVLYELTKFWLVARTESLDVVLPHLFGGMGLPAEVPARSNVTGITIDKHAELTPNLADQIRQQNPQDVMLYAALPRFEASFLRRQAITGEATDTDKGLSTS
jgi:hypothetical protein